MDSDRISRQSFLGPKASKAISSAVVGIVGLGGGGSHVVQQLAHIGFQRFELFDADVIEESNLNRLVGATALDVKNSMPKVKIAERVILGLQDRVEINANFSTWQEKFRCLQRCHIVFGCLDSFLGREELERFTRRYMLSYIDIGMDVVIGSDGKPVVGGQVILSTPGLPCMRCMGFLSNELLKREAERYGDAGPRPQVVWMNGILASAAVGLAVDLLTDWTGSLRQAVYLEYDGRKSTLVNRRGIKTEGICEHYSLEEVGEPVFREL